MGLPSKTYPKMARVFCRVINPEVGDIAHLLKKPETMIYKKMTDRDLERLQTLAIDAALIVQDYRPAGMDTIEWMAQCDQYRELAMMGSYCLLELTTRNKERSHK
jgi:hypothetical protein